ncbi:hypothetical protein [Allohahella marinimesophila]|uniref:Uncharacterized protein n=1 Tax=Allohahella marinimesophila TaxID=1054972 RepID=A0ABP7Q3D2_9GAMM
MKLHTSRAAETEDVGLADNDIDGFLKNLAQSVSRESTQNSNDEALARPVKVSFDLVSVPTSEIPNVDNYRDVLRSCLAEAQNNNDKKANEFFINALKVIAKPEVPIFLISDSGTKGAGGTFGKGQKFYTLAISKGRTDKDNVYSAGSFGIGKNAAFAGSEMRLVFYSTVYGDDPANHFYCMGKSILTSWRDSEDNNMSHKVLFLDGSGEFTPHTSQSELPSWLQKSERGLQVAIVAPRIEIREHWQASFIANALSNFFAAIYTEDIEFELGGGSDIINNSTMLEYFSRDDVKRAADESGLTEQFERAEMCTRAFAAGSFVSEDFSVEGLGDFEALIHVDEGLPKKVCIVRNGMYITDSLKNFGRPLKSFPNSKDFIMLVRPKSVEDSSSERLKRMENPEHNELTTGYIADESEVRKLQKAVEKLETGVRAIVKKYAKLEVTSTKNIDELKDYFASPGKEEGDGTNEDDPTKTTAKKFPTKQPSPNAQQPGSGGGGKGKKNNTNKKTHTKRAGPGGGASGLYKPLPARTYAARSSATTWRIEIATPPPSAQECEIWPQATSRGKDTKPLKVKSCNLPGAIVSPDGLSVKLPLAGAGVSFDLDLENDADVVDLRPLVKS